MRSLLRRASRLVIWSRGKEDDVRCGRHGEKAWGCRCSQGISRNEIAIYRVVKSSYHSPGVSMILIHVVWRLRERSESVKIVGGDYELGLGKVVGLPIWDIVYGWAGQPLADGILYQGC